MASELSDNEPIVSWDRVKLGDYIADRALSFWSENKQPYLLSYIGPDLTKIGIEYRSIIGPLKLKDFVSKELSGRLNVVAHSIHSAKVGLVPVGVVYRFDDDHVKVVEGSLDAAAQKAVLSFVDAIAQMDDDVIASWSIPAIILKRLAISK